jgi:hypothetical protein
LQSSINNIPIAKNINSKEISIIHNASNLLGITTKAFLIKEETFLLYGSFPNYAFWVFKSMFKALNV